MTRQKLLMRGKERIKAGFYLDLEIYKELRLRAAKDDVRLYEVVETALVQYFECESTLRTP